MTKVGIYIHIPFCLKKCNYCDFLSFLLPCRDKVADYVLGLKKELGLAGLQLKSAQAATVYLGGGTPSLLSGRFLNEILSAVKESFSLSPSAEVTVEVNPGTVYREKLRDMAAMGVNRLSLGVQSFEDHLLVAMGRIHTAKEAREAFCLARQEGFGNINVDLIYGLPGQTLQDWRHTLYQAAELEPEHVSAYGLSLEKGTVWGDLQRKMALTLPDEETWVRMHSLTKEILAQEGLLQYEISNYAKEGHQSQHNLGYWARRPYLGIGLGASSFIRETRYRNHTKLDAYLNDLDMNRLPIAEKKGISREEAMSETMFLGLRTGKGINALEFERQFGIGLEKAFPAVPELVKHDVLAIEGPWLKLNPEYHGISNEVFLKFI